MELFEKNIKALNDIDLKEVLEKSYPMIIELIENGVSIKEIVNSCKTLNGYEIIHELLKNKGSDENIKRVIEDYHDSFRITGDRCLIISDTHIGRLKPDENQWLYKSINYYMNEEGFKRAIDYAQNSSIKNIIHVGDIIEGKVYSEEGQSRLYFNRQMYYLEKLYSQIDDIKTYLLYGNHDLLTINYYDYHFFKQFYKKCNNMELVGADKAYLLFNNNRIQLSHPCSIGYRHLLLPYDLKLEGHSHEYRIVDSKGLVKVPALASLKDHRTSATGFLELIDEEKEFLIKRFDEQAKYVEEKRLEKVRRPY